MRIELTLNEILRSATPEQAVLWNYVFTRFGENAAISQKFFQGEWNPGEFANYVARRLYLAYDLIMGPDSVTGPAVNTGAINLFNEANFPSLALRNINHAYDTGAVSFQSSMCTISVKNVLFSRIQDNSNSYTTMRFCGFMITY